jgi:hypothetical protein
MAATIASTIASVSISASAGERINNLKKKPRIGASVPVSSRVRPRIHASKPVSSRVRPRIHASKPVAGSRRTVRGRP